MSLSERSGARQGGDNEVMSTPSGDDQPASSSDERDVGWGGRDWERDDPSKEDPDLDRLRDDRPPHHEERER
jgi:hypothetical protein